ncbi:MULTISPECIES: penicillin acylase family protein [Methylococcus]|uniref:Penicillin acylase family protein n=1 Tax=Methylococcus capsulatus TaxID=414 RepID=A0ABZ2F8C1_METCP|nr:MULTISPECIES: penicillin acylase family protein [Methylococcus]MDF9392892.1 penicillin acylase family protein [Methylococcus capsulatus]
MKFKHILYLAGFGILALATYAGTRLEKAAASLPAAGGESVLPGLTRPATVEFDRLGIPRVTAANREDAMRVLGYLHARDRLFQMDLMRRKGAGRLAEIFGEQARAHDRAQRIYAFGRAAAAIVAALPESQRRALDAYVAGVNARMAEQTVLPPEMLVLGYTPEPWGADDSLLVGLNMFQTLNGHPDEERMLSVMAETLPPEVLAFLTPDVDAYTTVLAGGNGSRRPERPVPAAALAELLSETRHLTLGAAVDADPLPAGSNNWAVAGTRTRDGRAIVANDMHLNLGVPNIWYRAELRYGEAVMSGVTLPGLPLLVAGSNGRIAWGFTNVDADVLDLVKLEMHAFEPDRYRTPEGWATLDTRTETLRVKDGADETLVLKSSRWGPVMAEPLLGVPVALRWTALEVQGVDLGLLDMDGAGDLDSAMAVMNRAGSPPQNVVLADRAGHIAWTLTGRFPLRRGFDGSVSRRWSDGAAWDGFVPPERLPRVVDPAQGYLATANNRTLGRDYPYVIGHNYSNSYRAYRIGERLKQAQALTETELFGLQLDTRSEFFEFYRDLVLALTANADDPALIEAHRAAKAWDGRMEADSRGIALLVRYRRNLARTIFSRLLARCNQADPGFVYAWREAETPLRALISSRLPGTVPDRSGSWDAFLRGVLEQSVDELKNEFGAAALQDLAWGRVNRVAVRHPFSKNLPLASALLDMPAVDGAGCGGHCIRVLTPHQGASERLVVSPGHHDDGVLHMPAGQSGHPLSPHYRDQQDAWASGRPLPFEPGPAVETLRLRPAP